MPVPPALGDIVIVHTCAVTAEAERQARQAIRRLRRSRPAARIVVTGCGVQLAPDAYAAMPEIDHLLGNAEKLRPESWAMAPAGRPGPGRRHHGGAGTAAHLVDGFERRTRAFLQVQQGCDHRCTFCIIPLAAAPAAACRCPRSSPRRARCRERLCELIVTGVDIASYGRICPAGRASAPC